MQERHQEDAGRAGGPKQQVRSGLGRAALAGPPEGAPGFALPQSPAAGPDPAPDAAGAVWLGSACQLRGLLVVEEGPRPRRVEATTFHGKEEESARRSKPQD